MNCGESREYLFAFLDNELETPLSIELQRHLDGCPDCAREAEIERTVHKKLAQGMVVPVPQRCEMPDVTRNAASDRDTRDDEASRAVRQSHRNTLVQWNRAAPIAAGLIIVTGVVLWYSFASGRLPTSRATLVELAVADFEHFLEEGGDVQIQADDRRQVEVWLERKTGLAVHLPHLEDSPASLVGGRKCKLDGLPAAFAVYRIQNTPASLVAVDVDDATLHGMTEIDHAGETILVGRQGEYRVAARRRGALVYAAVSTLPETELFCLLTDRSYESH